VRRTFLIAATVAACLYLGGCAGRATVGQWARSSGVIGLDNTVASDVHGIMGAAAQHKPAELIVTICDALFSDASQAYDSVLPTPDNQVTNELDTAYVHLENGAQDCSTSVGSNASSAAHAYKEIEKGITDLQVATQRLASLGVT
jgi:hypothetical protein